MKFKMNKKLLFLKTGLASALILSFLFLTGVFSNIQLKLVDNLYGGKQPLDSIVIIGIDDKSIQEIGRWPWNREVFAELMGHLHKAKVVGIDIGFFESSDKESDDLLAESIKSSNNVVLALEYTSFSDNQGKLSKAKEILLPIDSIRESAKSIGYINVITDGDGIARAVNNVFSDEYSSFTAEIYKLYLNRDFNDNSARYLVDFIGPPKTFTHYSISDVINSRVSDEQFSSKIVLIGATAHDLHDEFMVPTSKGTEMAGVEAHANVLQTMINNNELKQVHWLITILLILFLSLLISFIAEKTKHIISAALMVVLTIIYLFVCIIIFEKGTILNIIYIPLSMFISYISYLGISYSYEKKEKKKVTEAFGKYVSPVLVKEIMKDYSKLKLGGEKRDITILFSDIRDFTSISEKMAPEELVRLLNQYLSEMTDIIIKNKGLVDKYIGDAIMAFWNAPLDVKNHSEMACLSALNMFKGLKKLQKEWASHNHPYINIGIGINTGPAVVGNMGSKERFDYTAMGDTVNLASRIEGLTKYYKVNILISQNTYNLVKSVFLCRKIDLVAVKGKKEPIVIYELISPINESTEIQKKLVQDYEKAFSLYFNKEFSKALSLFNILSKEDESSKEFVLRCKEFEKNPPETSWNGVWTMKSK